jgi:hypothetical protein
MANIDKAITAYINIRDEIAARKKVFDESIKDLKEKQGKIAAHIDSKLTELGVDSIKSTTAGTAFRKTTSLISVSDKAEYATFVLARIEELGADGLCYLTMSASKPAVVDYMDENDDRLPPGIKFDQKTEIQIRKPTKAK